MLAAVLNFGFDYCNLFVFWNLGFGIFLLSCLFALRNLNTKRTNFTNKPLRSHCPNGAAFFHTDRLFTILGLLTGGDDVGDVLIAF